MYVRNISLLLGMAYLAGVATPFAVLALGARNSIGGRLSFLVLLVLVPLLLTFAFMVLAR